MLPAKYLIGPLLLVAAGCTLIAAGIYNHNPDMCKLGICFAIGAAALLGCTTLFFASR